MLDVRKIRQNPQEVLDALKKRNQDISIDLFLSQDEQRRTLLSQTEEKKAMRNQLSKQMGMARKKGACEAEISALMEEMRSIGDEIATLDDQIAHLDSSLEDFLKTLPNLPHASVPLGTDNKCSAEVRLAGTPRIFEWEPKKHAELRTDLNLVSAFDPSVVCGMGARLELALACFFQDAFSQDGYAEMLLPHPDASALELFRDAIFSRTPVGSCAYKPCASQLVVHQIITPDMSASAMESMTASMEKALLQLGLSCRIVEVCTGCLDFSAAKTYALEVWMPSCENYVRFAECSDTADFIARRMGIRYRQDAKDKPHIAHIISGTLNISCVFNAILENNQNGDGTVNVPECLKAAMKTELISK